MQNSQLSFRTNSRYVSGAIAMAIISAMMGCDSTETEIASTQIPAFKTGGHLVSINSVQSQPDTKQVLSDNVSNPTSESRTTWEMSGQATIQLDPTDRRPPILSIALRDQTHFGVPIGLFSDRTLLMRNDGAIEFVQNDHILRQTILQDRFQSIDRNELAQQLNSEFGRKYAVRFDAPYLIVAHPTNIASWTQRFRSIYHSFRLYCTTRGIACREIEFPLVAIVLGSHQEFLRYAESERSKLPSDCVGYYSQKSNRTVLFESSTGPAQMTLETICHEATHQLAFNTGLHQRLAMTPLWVAEGFATMFESPRLSGLKAREGGPLLPDSRRQEWQDLSKDHDRIFRLVEQLVRSDSEFEKHPQQAYCVSWAMTTYLSQRRPQPFSQYLSCVAGLPPFEKYVATQRIDGFGHAFGLDHQILVKNMIAYIDSLE